MTSIDTVHRIRVSGFHYMLLLACTQVGISLIAGCTGEGQSRGIEDRIRGIVPDEAIAQAQHALPLPIARVRQWHLDFSSKKLYMFHTDNSWRRQGPYVLLLQKGNRFVKVNWREGLPGLCEIMRDYHFARADFWDHRKVTDFCEKIVYISGVPQGSVLLSDLFLEETDREDPNGTDSWPRYAIDVSVFRNLCHDPGLALDRNDWVAVFNVLAPDGSVDVWRVSGVWDPRSETNTIEKIERFLLYDRHTFNYLLIGG